jgi:hypothetical protein
MYEYFEIELSQKKIFKKINFMLQMKGMSIVDWLNATEYENGNSTDQIKAIDLTNLLDKMGIKLEAGEKSFLLNFISI